MECSIEPGTEAVNDNGPLQLHKCSTQVSTNVPEKENSNNILVENHYSNSNDSDSYLDSVKSLQNKSESTEQNVQNSDGKNKDENSVKVLNTNNQNTMDDTALEEDFSEEGSEIASDLKAEDTDSTNSETGDDIEQESEVKNENRDVIMLENDNENTSSNQNGEPPVASSPEVHEITLSDNDDSDCVVTSEDKSDSETKVQLRRSSRAIKRKIYSNDDMDDESDVVEVIAEDPLSRKTKPIVINDTKALVEMAVKQMKANQGKKCKSETTVVIIDTDTITTHKGLVNAHQGKTSVSCTKSPVCTQNSYQNMIVQASSVTALNSKTTISTQPQQPSILPSLTDDMFVVEAPSFIVPYVYEKPSLKPFREFVDILGKELEEQEAKEEKERLAKEMEEKDKKDKEKEERSASGEEVREVSEVSEIADKPLVTEDSVQEEERKKKKAEKRERRRHRNEDDDISWDGDSSTDSSDEVTDEEDKIQVIKDKVDSIEEIKDITYLTAEKVASGKSDNYFDCSLGKFFINIGLNLVQEFVQNDLLKQQNRKLQREKKSGHSTKATQSSIASLMKNLEISKENNLPYAFTQIKCEFCSFKTESALVMAHHLETPHMKNNVYKCNFCAFEIRSPHDILYHMEAEHNIKGKLERAPAYHQCANCPFEDNGKGKLARHLIPCAKKFRPEVNLAPPVEWEPPAKIPKISKSRNSMMNSYQNAFNRHMSNNLGRPPVNMATFLPNVGNVYRPRGRAPMAVPPRSAPIHGTPIVRGGAIVRHNSPSSGINYPVANNGKNASVPKSLHQPSISITPLPHQPQPIQSQPTQQSKGTFVICEICDGYIKDLEQLRNHMQWIHKVKIHPKMIYNRPPLNCQKCQFRFFTDQGLERHLLGSHGLVTSSMQEAANKGKDSGRCPVCGRVYQWKLLNHVARDHNLTLKPAHLSYKCTVCTATFGMYKQFENHVYSAHSVVAKRVMDKSKTSTSPAKTNSDTHLKPLKINDEITIIPQPIKQTTPMPAKEK